VAAELGVEGPFCSPRRGGDSGSCRFCLASVQCAEVPRRVEQVVLPGFARFLAVTPIGDRQADVVWEGGLGVRAIPCLSFGGLPESSILVLPFLCSSAIADLRGVQVDPSRPRRGAQPFGDASRVLSLVWRSSTNSLCAEPSPAS